MSSSISGKFFGTLCDGEIEIRLLTEEYVDGAIEVLKSSFFVNENVCIATDICLPESIAAKKELEILGRGMIQDGASLVAKHVPTNRIVGVAVNTVLYVPALGEITFFEEFEKTKVHTPNMKSVMTFLSKMDEEFNIFENWDIDCIFEVMFLSIHPEFERRKIGRALCAYSIDFAKELNQGIGIELLRDGLRDKRPKAVSALFTSKISQRIGENLGFELLRAVPYDLLSHDGKTFAEKIGPDHPTCNISGIRL